MGKGALLLVLTSFMAMSLSYVSKDESQYNQAREKADYEEKVLARETAQSAYNIITSRVKNDFDGYRGSVANKALTSGNYDYSATGAQDGSVTVTAKGKIGNHEYQITGTVSRSGQRLIDALTIDGPIDKTDFKNSYQVTGNNTKPDGSDDSGIDVHAILTTSQTAYNLLSQDFDSGQVTGVDGTLDMVKDDPLINLTALGEAILAYSGQKRVTYSGDKKFDDQTFGSSANPVIVVVEGDVELKGQTRGYGILYVKGKIKMQNDARWEGLIYSVANGETHEFKNDSAVYGAVVLRTTSDGSNTGSTGGNVSDRGLIGGHFDVDVFDSATEKEIYHEHQYDDKYNVTGVDLLSAGCKKGGLCWDDLIGSQNYDEIEIEVVNAGQSEGTYRLQTGSTLYTAASTVALSKKVDPDQISLFDFNFTSLCSLRGTEPKKVQGDTSDRDNAFTVRIYGKASGGNNNNNSNKKKKSKKNNGNNGNSGNNTSLKLIYEISIYHHLKKNSTACSDNADPDETEANTNPMTLKLKNNARIAYSAKTLKVLKPLIALINIEENQITERKTAQLTQKKANALLRYR